jgi:hypothetical protein
MANARTSPPDGPPPVWEIGSVVLTVVVAEVVLFAVINSVVVVDVFAVLVMNVCEPTVGAVTVMVTVAVGPTAPVPSAAVTVPPECVQLPPVELTHETKVTPAGSVSVSVTPAALAAPIF